MPGRSHSRAGQRPSQRPHTPRASTVVTVARGHTARLLAHSPSGYFPMSRKCPELLRVRDVGPPGRSCPQPALHDCPALVGTLSPLSTPLPCRPPAPLEGPERGGTKCTGTPHPARGARAGAEPRSALYNPTLARCLTTVGPGRDLAASLRAPGLHKGGSLQRGRPHHRLTALPAHPHPGRALAPAPDPRGGPLSVPGFRRGLALGRPYHHCPLQPQDAGSEGLGLLHQPCKSQRKAEGPKARGWPHTDSGKSPLPGAAAGTPLPNSQSMGGL